MTKLLNAPAFTPALAVLEFSETALCEQDDGCSKRNSPAGDIVKDISESDHRLWERSKPCSNAGTSGCCMHLCNAGRSTGSVGVETDVFVLIPIAHDFGVVVTHEPSSQLPQGWRQ